MAKCDVSGPYPPHYVSAKTLAKLLDMSRSQIYALVDRELLPKPLTIGTQPRWYWGDVVSFIARQNGVQSALELDYPALSHGGILEHIQEEDPYLKGLKRAASS